MLSKALGNQTILSGSVSKGKDTSRTLQMMQRPLMTPDELKSIPKGNFIVMKTGTHPMKTRLRLFLEWGITFGEPYILPERAARKVAYADRDTLMRRVHEANPSVRKPKPIAKKAPPRGGMRVAAAQAQISRAQTATPPVPEPRAEPAREERRESAYQYGRREYKP